MTEMTDQPSLHAGKRELDKALGHWRSILDERDRLRGVIRDLAGETRALRENIARFHDAQASLGRGRGTAEEEDRRRSRHAAEVERRNLALASLYVACSRLHDSLERADVILAIEAIVINLVGSEEFAVFELSPGDRVLILLSSRGIDVEAHRRIALGAGPIGEAALQGQVLVADDLAQRDRIGMAAFVPLVVGDRLTGAVVLFQLLPHKKSIGWIDRELLEMLRVHAAGALYCSRLAAAQAG